jgi:predicted permease
MEISSYFKSISQAMLQLFFLGLVGFALAKRRVLLKEGVNGLAGFLIVITFPCLVFTEVIGRFSFSAYPDWWLFPLMSLAVSGLGLFVGYVFSAPLKDAQIKREFIGLTGFQNSGYLPLALLGWLLPKEQLGIMLIYLFLFLLGFNLVIWSWGVYFLSAHKLKKFSFSSLFSPPVIAVLLGFLFIFLKAHRFVSKGFLAPLEMLGKCSFPLAMVVVGAGLAELSGTKSVDKKVMLRLVLAKLILLPSIGLLWLGYFRLPYLVGLLVILELAVPSANSLAVIARQYAQGEKIISRGIFISHITSLVTLPLFLAAYNLIVFRR